MASELAVATAAAAEGRAIAPPPCPRHETWPAWLKWYLLAMWLRARLFPWKTEQEVWEQLLADAFNGIRAGSGKPNADQRFNLSTPAGVLFPHALERARTWKAAGGKITED